MAKVIIRLKEERNRHQAYHLALDYRHVGTVKVDKEVSFEVKADRYVLAVTNQKNSTHGYPFEFHIAEGETKVFELRQNSLMYVVYFAGPLISLLSCSTFYVASSVLSWSIFALCLLLLIAFIILLSKNTGKELLFQEITESK